MAVSSNKFVVFLVSIISFRTTPFTQTTVAYERNVAVEALGRLAWVQQTSNRRPASGDGWYQASDQGPHVVRLVGAHGTDAKPYPQWCTESRTHSAPHPRCTPPNAKAAAERNAAADEPAMGRRAVAQRSARKRRPTAPLGSARRLPQAICQRQLRAAPARAGTPTLPPTPTPTLTIADSLPRHFEQERRAGVRVGVGAGVGVGVRVRVGVGGRR